MTEWISVEDRLPDKMQNYLVSDGRLQAVSYYEFGTFTSCHSSWDSLEDMKEVTHWMPLPEPPKQ